MHQSIQAFRKRIRPAIVIINFLPRALRSVIDMTGLSGGGQIEVQNGMRQYGSKSGTASKLFLIRQLGR